MRLTYLVKFILILPNMKKYVENGVWDNVFWIDQCTFSVFCFGYIKKISFFFVFLSNGLSLWKLLLTCMENLINII